MLETEEVDDDYFTPVASASLANIFGKPVTDELSENESLKYTPTKPINVKQQPEDSKATSCVLFACALVGYEWHNNVYSQKGRLGFALVKIIKTGSHNIILYDSNKTTLSNTSVTTNLNVIVKSNNYISYYDDQIKYWSLNGAENEIKKISDLLKMLGVTINTSTETDINPPEPVKTKEMMLVQEESKQERESDTDSSVNRKTKASILNRMANMGHSVLPPNAMPANKTSDSSDTNDTIDHHIKAVRHKPIKGVIKRNSADKSSLDHQKVVEVYSYVENPRIGHTTEIKNANSFISDQLMPLANTTIVTSPSGNDMNLFITEQRISNSELRINMGRITDKVDHIINKINTLELKDQNEGTSNVNTDILHKLLREYEKKIKKYEDLLQKMGTSMSTHSLSASSDAQSNQKNEEALQNKIEELQNIIKEKDGVVLLLQNEVQTVKDTKEQQKKVLQKNVCELEADLLTNKIVLKELTEANEKLSTSSTGSDIENKIKSLMNDTYQAVAMNFENGETYSGESIKKTIAMVIKKVTIKALNEPK
ncbi:Peptidyl-prolyl cis-trans isomerase [Operophtera brumata]|uniref:Peptidyl-prolyl cis-trans isomerase n=1 Tax=Operophtera brumata TaxID=104452 RepID=A0A0L7KTH2_OPEBR|nr:Peptidyl-prolyl cis-trans isomerase [Operophtera brumata]